MSSQIHPWNELPANISWVWLTGYETLSTRMELPTALCHWSVPHAHWHQQLQSNVNQHRNYCCFCIDGRKNCSEAMTRNRWKNQPCWALYTQPNTPMKRVACQHLMSVIDWTWNALTQMKLPAALCHWTLPHVHWHQQLQSIVKQYCNCCCFCIDGTKECSQVMTRNNWQDHLSWALYVQSNSLMKWMVCLHFNECHWLEMTSPKADGTAGCCVSLNKPSLQLTATLEQYCEINAAIAATFAVMIRKHFSCTTEQSWQDQSCWAFHVQSVWLINQILSHFMSIDDCRWKAKEQMALLAVACHWVFSHLNSYGHLKQQCNHCCLCIDGKEGCRLCNDKEEMARPSVLSPLCPVKFTH